VKNDNRKLKNLESTVLVVIEAGVHLFPFRTQKLSPPSPMLLRLDRGKVGRCQDSAFYLPEFSSSGSSSSSVFSSVARLVFSRSFSFALL
jgi:hypothetical protein